MKVISITNFDMPHDLKLTKQQMISVKGGDDDVFLNTGTDTTTLNFGG